MEVMDLVPTSLVEQVRNLNAQMAELERQRKVIAEQKKDLLKKSNITVDAMAVYNSLPTYDSKGIHQLRKEMRKTHKVTLHIGGLRGTDRGISERLLSYLVSGDTPIATGREDGKINYILFSEGLK